VTTQVKLRNPESVLDEIPGERIEGITCIPHRRRTDDKRSIPADIHGDTSIVDWQKANSHSP
jgi:hypothetical protein